MWRTVLAQLRFRSGRAVALLAALVVAVTSFAVLTASASTQRLEVRGTVDANARGAYDLLVRPSGARSALEKRRNLVSATALSGLSGGISRSQWQKILKVPGVGAAAPVAVVGYAPSTVHLPVDLSKYIRPDEKAQLWRLKPKLVSERGLTSVPADTSYVYVTRQELNRPKSTMPKAPGLSGRIDLIDEDGQRRKVCDAGGAVDTGTNRNIGVTLACGSTAPHNNVNRPGAASPHGSKGGNNSPAGIGYVDWSFPYLVAAIDPVQEARLVGLDKAMVQGPYFTPDQKPQVRRESGDDWTEVPVLLADRTPVDEQLKVEVEELPAAEAARITAGMTRDELGRILPAVKGRPAGVSVLGSQKAYEAVVDTLGIAAASSKCNAVDLPPTDAARGTRSWALDAGSRASQYVLHTVADAAAAADDVPPAEREDSVAMSTSSAAEVYLCDFMDSPYLSVTAGDALPMEECALRRMASHGRRQCSTHGRLAVVMSSVPRMAHPRASVPRIAHPRASVPRIAHPPA